MKFLIVNDIKEINLTEKGWVDSPKFEADKFVDANGKRIKKSYTGQRYSLIAIREREFSCLEVIGRRFLGLIAVIVTLGLVYFKSKTVKNLLKKTKERIYYGMILAAKNPTLPKIEFVSNPIKLLNSPFVNLNEIPKVPPVVNEGPKVKTISNPKQILKTPIILNQKDPAHVININIQEDRETKISHATPNIINEPVLKQEVHAPEKSLTPIPISTEPPFITNVLAPIKDLPDPIHVLNEVNPLKACEIQSQVVDAPNNNETKINPPAHDVENEPALNPDVQEPKKRVIPIQIIGGDETFQIEASPEETLEKVKEKIELFKGFSIEKQRFYWNEESISDKKTLADYNISENSPLRLLLNQPDVNLYDNMQKINPPAHHPEPVQMQEIQEAKEPFIVIKVLKGEKFQVNATSEDTIAEIKRRIELKNGTPIDEQKLIYKGKILSNEESLSSYNIPRSAEIVLFTKQLPTPYLIIKTTTDRTFEIDATANATIGEIKQKIALVDGVPAENQRLLFKSKVLDDASTLSDYNIQKNSTLSLVLIGRRD